MALAAKTRDVGIGALVALVFYASGFLVIFTPLPFLYVTVEHGRRAGGVISLMTVLVVIAAYAAMFHYMGASPSKDGVFLASGFSMSGFLSPGFLMFAGIGYFVFFMAMGLALADGVLRKMSLARMGAYALVAGLVILAVMLAGANFFETKGFVDEIKNYIQQAVSGIVAANQVSSTGAEAEFLKNNAGEIASFVLGLTPSIIFVFAVVAVAVNLLIGRRIIKARHAFAHVHNAARFKLPDAMIWAVVASGAAFFADRYALHTGIVETAAINFLIGIGALYFFQGFAVVVYFLQGIKLPLLRSIAYIMMILFFQSIGLVIVGIGVADVWADFRLRSWRARHAKDQS